MATTLRLDETLARKLKERSGQTGQPQAYIVSEAVRQYLDGPNPDASNLPWLGQATAYRELPEPDLITGGPPSEVIVNELRADRY